MKRIFALMAALAVATPVQAQERLPVGWGWNINENVRFQFAPDSITNKPTVSDGNTISGTLEVIWKGTRRFPIYRRHEGNTCGRQQVGPGESALTVCIDRSYYVIQPNWDQERYFTRVENLKCSRPIYFWESKLNLQSACDYFKNR